MVTHHVRHKQRDDARPVGASGKLVAAKARKVLADEVHLVNARPAAKKKRVHLLKIGQRYPSRWGGQQGACAAA